MLCWKNNLRNKNLKTISMKNKIILIILIFNSFLSYSQFELLSHNVYKRIFNIKYGINSGTAFLVQHDSSSYYVTAKHLLKNKINNDTITVEVFQNSKWKLLSGNILLHKNNQIDVALIKSNHQGYVGGFPIETFFVPLGDEGRFLGFPLGIKDTTFQKYNDGFPLPLIKKAIFSGSIVTNGVTLFLLDGHNNPGFSGGPVFFKNWEKKWSKDKSPMALFGLVTAYVNQKNEIQTPIGNFKFNENSGIIISYGTAIILEIIAQSKISP